MGRTHGTREPSGVLEHAGSRIHYWLSGPASGRLVACSHGASMDHRMFEPQLPVLHDAGYRVLTWDGRGHGQSKPIGDLPLSTAAMADDLAALLDAVGATEPICLVGQSLGGYVAQEFVLTREERVAAMVVVGATSTTLPLAAWERWTLRSSPWWFHAWPEGNLRKVIAKATAHDPDVQAYALDACSQLTKAEFVAVWHAVAGAIHVDLPPGYQISQPLLLTHGEHDRTGNVAKAAPRWAERDPRCRYEVIPRASHNANQDNPEVFNRIMLEFLADHYPAGLQ